MSELRTKVEHVIGDWPYRRARSAVRVVALLESKSASAGRYWSEVGRSRAERELHRDGLSPEAIDQVIAAIDMVLDPDEPDLEAVLRDLASRRRS